MSGPLHGYISYMSAKGSASDRVRVSLRQGKDGSGCGRLSCTRRVDAPRVGNFPRDLLTRNGRLCGARPCAPSRTAHNTIVLFGRRAAPAAVLWIIRIILYYLLIHIMYYDTLGHIVAPGDDGLDGGEKFGVGGVGIDGRVACRDGLRARRSASRSARAMIVT